MKFEKIEPITNLDNGKEYQITLSLPMDFGWYEDVKLIIEKGNDKLTFPLQHAYNQDGNAIFTTKINLETRAIYHYYFTCLINGNFKYIKKDKVIGDTITPLEKSKMSVGFEVPDWAKGAIMYHVFVDRYKRGSGTKMPLIKNRHIHKSWNEDMIIGPDENGIWNNDFYGGDLKGIEKSLDYIKSLGATIIYLSPIVESQSNHRYDTADYSKIDPYLGNEEDLKSLCESAHKKGIKIILDAVFNHTGNDSKYFNEYGTYDSVGAFQSKDSPYTGFYKKHEENNQTKFDYWWGMKNLPVCDGTSNIWKDFITKENGVIDKWFDLGIDGLRLDVADELTDEFIELIRKAVKRNKEDGLIIGEVWKNPMRMNRGYIESGKCMDSVMDYPLVDALIRYFKYCDISKLSYIIQDIQKEYPTDTINTLMNFTSTHDITRAINIFATYAFDEYREWAWDLRYNDLNWCRNFKLSSEQYKLGRNIYEAYVFTLAFLPGILSIFYGDEVGIEGMGNLANRKPYPWNYRDKKLLEYFRKIGYIRQKEQFLKEADLNILDINDRYFMFERLSDNDKMLVTVNRTNDNQKFSIPSEYEKSSESYVLKKSSRGYLRPYGAIAIKK